MNQFAELLKSKLRKDMNDYADMVSTTGCKTWDEYREALGVIKGLAIAERYLIDLSAEQEVDDGQ